MLVVGFDGVMAVHLGSKRFEVQDPVLADIFLWNYLKKSPYRY